jgi:hypothetical protein
VSGVDRIYAILPFVVLVLLGAAFAFVFRERAATRRAWTERRIVEPDVARPSRDPIRHRRADGRRPWWGSPWPWFAVCAVSIALGYVLWPGLFAVPLVVLAVAWFRRPRREPPIDPRTNGHAKRDGPGSFGTG